MLRHTFIHLPGVGAHRERQLWEQGILDWDRFLAAAESGCCRCGGTRRSRRWFASPWMPSPLATRASSSPSAPARDVAALPGVRRPGPVPGHRDHRPVARLRRGDGDRRAGRRQAGPVRQGHQPRPVPRLRRAVPAPGHVQRQPVRRAVPAGAFSPGPAGSGPHRPAVRARARWATGAG